MTPQRPGQSQTTTYQEQHTVRLVCAALAIALGMLSMRIAGIW